MEEIWKDIKGYEGLYQVSNLGRVRSLDRKRWDGRKWCKCKGRTLVGRPTKMGYLRVGLGRGVDCYIHRLVAQAFLVNTNNKSQINHKDGNKRNNSVNNLEWCSNSENMAHAAKKRLMRSGELHSNHKLTKDAVSYIRNKYQRYSREFNLSTLGRLFNVCPESVRRVVLGESWK